MAVLERFSGAATVDVAPPAPPHVETVPVEPADPPPSSSFWEKRRLKHGERSANRPSKSFAVEAGVAYGAGPLGGRAKGGFKAERRDPATGKRTYDIFGGAGPKVGASWIPTLATHGKSGIDTTVSVGGFGWSRHPVIGEQKNAKVTVVDTGIGELSPVGLEVPLALIAPLASLVGADEIASAIQSLGPNMWLTRVQLKAHLESERLGRVKERVDHFTNRLPHPKFKEAIKSRWKKRSGLPIDSADVYQETELEKELDEVVVVLTAEELVKEAEEKVLKTA